VEDLRIDDKLFGFETPEQIDRWYRTQKEKMRIINATCKFVYGMDWFEYQWKILR
jgi:hypothetical protein